MKPKVFVGTLNCGEGDYNECCSAIKQQRGVEVTHISISNLTEKEAHNNLWQSWRDAKLTHDMFVKVDADTVLSHQHVLLNFWEMMYSNPRITGIQAPLLDYFTDGYINGLNCFAPNVIFRDTADELFCDRQVDVNHDIVIKSNGVPASLKPAGYHCFHANKKQAFHFGVHRALKGQKNIIDLVKNAHQRHGDILRQIAILGAENAQSFSKGGFNYNDEHFNSVFESICNKVS